MALIGHYTLITLYNEYSSAQGMLGIVWSCEGVGERSDIFKERMGLRNMTNIFESRRYFNRMKLKAI